MKYCINMYPLIEEIRVLTLSLPSRQIDLYKLYQVLLISPLEVDLRSRILMSSRRRILNKLPNWKIIRLDTIDAGKFFGKQENYAQH